MQTTTTTTPERHIGPLFNPGRVVATPGAIRAIEEAGASAEALLIKHLILDPGALDKDDAEANREALRTGARIFSAYEIGPGLMKLWIITEADRSATTLLLPEEY